MNEVSVLIFQDDEALDYTFKLNTDGLIDLFVENKYMDTMHDVKIIKNLLHTVKYILNCWKADFEIL